MVIDFLVCSLAYHRMHGAIPVPTRCKFLGGQTSVMEQAHKSLGTIVSARHE